MIKMQCCEVLENFTNLVDNVLSLTIIYNYSLLHFHIMVFDCFSIIYWKNICINNYVFLFLICKLIRTIYEIYKIKLSLYVNLLN